jgi:hypothetical protein
MIRDQSGYCHKDIYLCPHGPSSHHTHNLPVSDSNIANTVRILWDFWSIEIIRE